MWKMSAAVTTLPVNWCVRCLNCHSVYVLVHLFTRKVCVLEWILHVCQHVWKCLCNNCVCEVCTGDLLCNSALCISVCECVPKLLGALEVCKASSGKFLDTLVQVPQLKLVIPGILEPAKTVEIFPSCLWSWIYSVASLPASREHTLWRISIQNQYFTPYTLGYHSAAVWHMDH